MHFVLLELLKLPTTACLFLQFNQIFTHNFTVAQSQAHGHEGKQGNSNTFYSDCVLPNRGALASLAKLQAQCSLSF